MASGLLSIAIIFFSFRGFFLGLSGVIARVLGIALGYVMAFVYRDTLAANLTQTFNLEVNPLLAVAGSSALLFFGTLFSVGFFIDILFKATAKLFPALETILLPKATGNRVLGAAANAIVGASIVLLGMWGYALVIDDNKPDSELQQFANQFGDKVLTVVESFIDDDNSKTTSTVDSIKDQTQSSLQSLQLLKNLMNNSEGNSETGISTLDINTNDMANLLKNIDINSLIKHSSSDNTINEEAINQLRDDPQKLMELLNNPKVQKALQQRSTE